MWPCIHTVRDISSEDGSFPTEAEHPGKLANKFTGLKMIYSPMMVIQNMQRDLDLDNSQATPASLFSKWLNMLISL